MPSVWERCCANAFAAADAAVSATCRRNPDSEPESDQLPAVDQFDGGYDRREGVTGMDEYTGRLEYDIAVRGSASENAMTAINAQLSLVSAALRADLTLSGVSQDIRHVALGDPEFADAQGGGRLAVATASFEIDFATAEGDPDSLPT